MSDADLHRQETFQALQLHCRTSVRCYNVGAKNLGLRPSAPGWTAANSAD